MNLGDYMKAVQVLLDFADSVEEKKRPAYTAGSLDVLHNFKRDADAVKITAAQNWATHMLKQAAALARWAQDPLAAQSEPVTSRFADLVNYAKLGYALYLDKYSELEASDDR